MDSDSPPSQGPWMPEIDLIETQIQRFVSGDLPPEKFREFRLIHGMYGQRQPDVHMLRVKLPNGVLNPDQLEALAEVAENHGHGLLHLTTRQDVQYHHIPLGEFPALFRRLAPSGIGAREACGNSVRNVTSCPRSGVCRTEPFPVLPYAEAVSRFLLRHPTAQLLARKFKIAVSGCAGDCAAGVIHDLGAIAAVRIEGGRVRRGFRILVGGGTGSVPYLAQELTDFLPAEEILRAAEAIVRIFSLHGNRRNRARARSKFIVAEMGIDRYRERFREVYAAIAGGDRVDLQVETYLEPHEIALLHEEWPVPAARPVPRDAPDADQIGYAAWVRANTLPERDPGRRSVVVVFPIGDARPEEFRLLARVARAIGISEVRVTKEQNLLIRAVPIEALPRLHAALDAAGLARPVADTLLDVLTCPGADTCNLGITTSKGLGRAIEEEFRSNGIDVGQLRGSSLKISGCPNGCSQHHVATIGMHGVARKVGGKQAPHYQMHLGGRVSESSSTIAKGSVKVPAKNAPRVIRRLVEVYLAERTDGEDLAAFLGRAETADVERWLGALLTIPGPNEAPDNFLDWGDTRTFSTANLGVGECAGAGVDVGSDPFSETLEHLKQVRVFLEKEIWVDALAELNRAVWSIPRVVLHQGIGKTVSSDWETFHEFTGRLVDRGHTSERFVELRRALDPLLAKKPVPREPLFGLVAEVERFLEEARALTTALAAWKSDPSRAPIPGLSLHGEGDAQG